MLVLALLAVASGEDCGGHLTSDRGLISTPGFPNPFPVPIRCLWLVSSASPTASVAVHLTQLYVTAGLTFTEYAYYEPGSTFQLEPRLVHRVTEENLPNTSLVVTSRPFLVVEFAIDRLEGNHLRALDGLLDVYGFNLTYSIQTDTLHLPDFSCTVAKCSMLGNCYATWDYSSFYCDCFPGFSGSNCMQGPLCQADTNQCKNGATCRHIGAHDTACDCQPGYKGQHCDRPAPLHDCNDDMKCTRQCPYDGTRENACTCDKDGVVAPQDMTHFECILRLLNSSSFEPGRALEMKLQKQMTKYLRSANLSKLDEAKVLNITSNGEVRFHFVGHKKDGTRVKELMLSLVEKGKLADFSFLQTQFSFRQEPTLLILKVTSNKKESRVRSGESFTVSCTAQGSSGLQFYWYKDGVPVNTSIAVRNMSIWEELESGEQRTCHLHVKSADPLDDGEYTCQGVDWGVQQCKSVYLQVVQPLHVTVAPMTSTVQKGSNLTIRCFTGNKPGGRKLGYNWTKNKALFPMNTESEFWEDLYPDGSILKLLNIQKGGVYTCSAAAGSWSGQAVSRLDVVDSPLAGSRCPGSGVWPPTAPGLQASAPCPPGYSGTALRLCLLLEPGHGRWQVPDYSDCRSLHTIAITNAFLGLGLGYEGTSAGNTVWEIATSVGGRGGAYPGEAEPLVTLLANILGYIQAKRDVPTLLNITDNFVTAVNGLLTRKSSIVNYQTLLSLTETVSKWCLWWGKESGGTWGHVLQGGVLISTLRINPLQRTVQVNIPRHGFRYPDWLTGKLEIHLENSDLENNSVLVVVVYRDLKKFFPKHFSQKLEDGRDVEFGVDGPVISIWTSPGLSVHTSLQTSSLCGSTYTGQTWDLSTCNQTAAGCLCQGSGLFAALASKSQLLKKESEGWRGSLRVKIGCSCSLVQALVTGILLAARFYRRPSCLLYLKLQSCLSLAAAMTIFLLAASDNIVQKSYTYLCIGLQLLLLVAISSQLAKLVIVYSEVLRIPMVRYFKQTVVIILSGLSGVCCLCTSIVEGYAQQEPWWWLRIGSPSFYVAVAYTAALLSLEVAIGVDLVYKISTRITTKAKCSLNTRAGLVKRSAILLLFIMLMASCSILYANSPTIASQNAFSISSGVLGFTLFTEYIVMSETTPKNVHLLKRIKDLVADEIYSSTSDNSFFTKQEAEAECEAAPPDVTAAGEVRGEEVLLRPGKPGTPRKCVSFHSDLVTGCKVIEDGGSPEGGSPEVKGSNLVRASYYQNPATDPARGCLQEIPTTRVCLELGLLQESSKSPPTLMVCNVDIEPSSRLVPVTEASPSAATQQRALREEGKADVLNRISHDLDYLLNSAPDEGANSEEETQTSL